jgi:hypothetical protein
MQLLVWLLAQVPCLINSFFLFSGSNDLVLVPVLVLVLVLVLILVLVLVLVSLIPASLARILLSVEVQLGCWATSVENRKR